jgi:FkbM family methyltransferase
MEQLTIEQFTVWCENREEALKIKQEIFTHHIYYFETDKIKPVIIDVGAHIGLATLYFKKLYPQAKVIAIEPHPVSFKLLEKNIAENYLEDVTCINGAVVGAGAVINGFHPLHVDTQFQWFSTASFSPGSWNKAQQTEPFPVSTLSLSEVIQSIGIPIDLLKIDIEGAEQEVLREARTTLAKVAHIICEYHMTDKQNRAEFLELLERSGYTVNHEGIKEKFHGKRTLEMIEALRKY